MKISCDIIRDILPLYAEDMVSNATKEMVDDHLCECENCTKELGTLKKAEKLPVEVDVNSLKRVGDSIRRRRVLAAMAAVLTVLTAFVTVVIFLMTPVYLTADQAIEGVELREDGGLAIDYARGVIGHAGWGYLEEGDQIYLCHTTRYDWFKDMLKDKELENLTQEELEAYIMAEYELDEMTQEAWDRFHSITVQYGTWETSDGGMKPYDPDTCREGEGALIWRQAEENHWYADIHDGSPAVLLWDAGKPAPEGSLFKAEHGYAAVFFGCVAITFASFLLSRKKTGTVRELLNRLTILGVSIAFSTLMVTGGNLWIVSRMSNYKWPGYIAAESVFLVLAALLWHQLYKLNKQDKGL